MNREEAIEVVRKNWPDSNYSMLREALETLIPGIKISEDERTRLNILALVKKHAVNSERCMMEDWLEKQKARGPLTKEEEYTLQRIIEQLEDEGCPQSWKDLLYDIYNLPYEKASEEDERIRNYIQNELVCLRASEGKGSDRYNELSSAIVYLEKQKEQPKEKLGKYSEEENLAYRLNWVMQDYIKAGEDEEEQERRLKCYKLFWDAVEDTTFFEQKEQTPKMTPKWLYRLEFKDSSCGLWYDGSGKWCFEFGIGSIDGCKTKTLPMDYDARYKQDGRDWFSSCSRKEDLMHWYSLEDAKELISKGFVFTRYLATEYHEYDQQTVFIKETALYREQIDIFELFGQRPAEWSEDAVDAMVKAYSDSLPMCGEFQSYHDALVHAYRQGTVNALKSLRPQPKQEWNEDFDKEVESVHKRYPEVSFAKLTRIAYHFAKWADKYKSTEWSEEDKEMINLLIAIFEVNYPNGFYKANPINTTNMSGVHSSEIISWLRLLRPQPQYVYQQTVECLRAMCDSYENNGLFTDERARDFLGNVRAKCKDAIECATILDEHSWKPSEEELIALKRVGGVLRDNGHNELAKTIFIIEGKLANLPVINESIWKPSKEQMNALADAITRDVFPKGNIEHLESLYNDLKKL